MCTDLVKSGTCQSYLFVTNQIFDLSNFDLLGRPVWVYAVPSIALRFKYPKVPKVSKAIKKCTVARYCFNREPNKCSIVKVELPSLNEFILHTSHPCRYCTHNPHLHQKTTECWAIHTRVHGWYLSGGSYSSLSYVKSLAVITIAAEPLAWWVTLEIG